MRINGKTCSLWRGVDHEGEVLEVFATKRQDRRAALRFLKRAMKRYGPPASVVTDRLASYRAAINVIGNAVARTCGRWLNNRAENSHQPFRRREHAMTRFRSEGTLQKFTSIHASVYTHFNHQRHLNRRDIFKQARADALAEWRQLAAWEPSIVGLTGPIKLDNALVTASASGIADADGLTNAVFAWQWFTYTTAWDTREPNDTYGWRCMQMAPRALMLSSQSSHQRRLRAGFVQVRFERPTGRGHAWSNPHSLPPRSQSRLFG